MEKPPYLNGWSGVPDPMTHLMTRQDAIERRVAEESRETRAELREVRQEVRRVWELTSARAQAPADTPSSLAATQSPASNMKDVVKEVGLTAKEIGIAARWILGIVALTLLAAKRLDVDQVRGALKAALGG